ncbi:hypothetical protein ABZY31_02285 [Streptomyces sp. NPDC006529]|uniref:DUF7848 domain-containing protein n=1 Tax=Streptomyces sp. NPDC006529 TaxID=3157177 RepID=UPI00339E745D
MPHTIRHAPEGGVTYEAFCAAYGCGAESGPQDGQGAAQDWALRHAGLSGHDLFRRVYTDHARVTPAAAGPSHDPGRVGPGGGGGT